MEITMPKRQIRRTKSFTSVWVFILRCLLLSAQLYFLILFSLSRWMQGRSTSPLLCPTKKKLSRPWKVVRTYILPTAMLICIFFVHFCRFHCFYFFTWAYLSNLDVCTYVFSKIYILIKTLNNSNFFSFLLIIQTSW